MTGWVPAPTTRKTSIRTHHLRRGAALAGPQPESGALGEAAEADRLGDVAFAADPLDVVIGEPVESLQATSGGGYAAHRPSAGHGQSAA